MRKATRRAATVAGMVAVLATTSVMMAPAFAVDSAATAAAIVHTEVPDGDAEYPGKEYIIDNYNKWDQIAVEYAPEIRQLPNGKLVQLTPTEYECPHWMQQSWTISYNTYYLDADNKGCLSCHYDLNQLIMDMPYRHATLPNKALETYSDVNQCISCHRDNGDEFGRLIHGIHEHSRNAEMFEAMGGGCGSCHSATGDGEGMQLWDNVKYKALGDSITTIENVEGNFSVTQDKVQSMDELYSYDFVHGYYDHMRYACSAAALDLELPMSMMEEWTITIEGNVPEPYTAKLVDLIAEAEEAGVVVTKPSKMVCDLNPVGGGGIGQTEITGIPVSWLIEKAGGMLEGTNSIRCVRADGSSKNGVMVSKLPEEYLVYKMDGQYLDASRGFPCTNWVEGYDAQVFSKQPSGYIVSTDDMSKGRDCGQKNKDGEHINRPNATICGTPEGVIIETGKPYTFQGYADAFDHHVSTIEFSMDHGNTWTAYEVGEYDVNKWLWWTFEWTPEENGAYCLMVRATTQEGEVSFSTHEVMVNAKSVLPSADEVVRFGDYDLPIQYSTGLENNE